MHDKSREDYQTRPTIESAHFLHLNFNFDIQDFRFNTEQRQITNFLE